MTCPKCGGTCEPISEFDDSYSHAIAEIARLRADLTNVERLKEAGERWSGDMIARLEADAASFRTHHLAETSRLTREVLEVRAELAQAQIERDCWKVTAGSATAELRADLARTVTDAKNLMETVRYTESERDKSLRTVERLRTALGHIAKLSGLSRAGDIARGALAATPAPVVPTMQEDPHWITMQTCMHHNDSQRERTGCPVCMMNDAEALAKVMQEIYDDSIDHVVTQLAQEALAAFRSRHTAPVKTP